MIIITSFKAVIIASSLSAVFVPFSCDTVIVCTMLTLVISNLFLCSCRVVIFIRLVYRVYLQLTADIDCVTSFLSGTLVSG